METLSFYELLLRIRGWAIYQQSNAGLEQVKEEVYLGKYY